MPMTVIVTRDVPARTRGFLASIVPEPAPGVYTAPDLTKGVRERIWAVVSDWHVATGGGSIVMIWRDDKSPGGLGLLTLALHRASWPIWMAFSFRAGDDA
jgi:CRISPR-associated protein Cas2